MSDASLPPERAAFVESVLERIVFLTGFSDLEELARYLGHSFPVASMNMEDDFPSAVDFFKRIVVQFRIPPEYILYGTGPRTYPEDQVLDDLEAERLLSRLFGFSVVRQ